MAFVFEFSVMRCQPLRRALGSEEAMRKKVEERLNRLNKGCCPVHGGFMSQVEGWYENEQGINYTVVGCSRNACKILARAFSYDGPWEIDEKYIHLFDENEVDPDFLDHTVKPNDRKSAVRKYRSDVFKKTSGFCYYCGVGLTLETLTVDHFVPESRGGKTELSNLFPCCKTCNSSKGTKDIEEFRFLCQMKAFKKEHGVEFDREQINFLSKSGFDIQLNQHDFWFEENRA
ncbi:TPA: HNH endonuclease [Vibrio cholerae]